MRDQKRDGLLLIVLVALVAAALTFGFQQVTNTQHTADSLARIHADTEAEVARLNQVVGEQILQLPEDGGLFYCSVFLHDDYRARADERQIAAWFESNARLRSLKAQTHFKVYTPKDPYYRAKLQAGVPVMPCVMVQLSDGRRIYKATGGNIPQTAEELANQLQVSFSNVAGGCCPRPKPNPQPYPDTFPKPSPDLDMVPDMGPPVKPASDVAWVVVLAGLSAGGLVAAWRYFEDLRG